MNKLNQYLEKLRKLEEGATKDEWHVSPDTCLYEVADATKKSICEKWNVPTKFNALAISNRAANKTLALIPLDDSNIENAQLIVEFRTAVGVLRRVVELQQKSLKALRSLNDIKADKIEQEIDAILAESEGEW